MTCLAMLLGGNNRLFPFECGEIKDEDSDVLGLGKLADKFAGNGCVCLFTGVTITVSVCDLLPDVAVGLGVEAHLVGAEVEAVGLEFEATTTGLGPDVITA